VDLLQALSCEEYLSKHKEIAYILADYVQCLIVAQPENVYGFSAAYFRLQSTSKRQLQLSVVDDTE
jgi:hypothetical protein